MDDPKSYSYPPPSHDVRVCRGGQHADDGREAMEGGGLNLTDQIESAVIVWIVVNPTRGYRRQFATAKPNPRFAKHPQPIET